MSQLGMHPSRNALCSWSVINILLRQPINCSFIQPLSRGSLWACSHVSRCHQRPAYDQH